MSTKVPGDKPTTKKMSNAGSSVHIGAMEESFGVDPQIVFEPDDYEQPSTHLGVRSGWNAAKL
ncbi:hypothetical protein FRC05_001892 [Tulasnella sp. 425]|nr:hypothetical protein FRC05_001892 [Tulasnella sp. 425]